MSESDVEPVPRRRDGLQIDERPAVVRRHWMMERFAWGIFLIVVAAAMAGLTGAGGIFSRQRIVVGGAEFDLPAVARWQSPDRVTIAFRVSGPDAPHEVVLGPRFLDLFATERMVPAPARQTLGRGGLRLEFGPGNRGIDIGLRARRPGRAVYAVAIDGVAAVARSHVLP